MAHAFTKHYTRDEARKLLPQLRKWLNRLQELRQTLDPREAQLDRLLEQGNDVGGPVVHGWVKTVADIREILREFELREIQIKDVDRGLVDFPAIIGGREVFLCWEKDESDIEFWHDLETGYAGRERI